MKHCILATDLALFFPNKARMATILKEGAFSWDVPDHRYGTKRVTLSDNPKVTGLTCRVPCSKAREWDSP